MGNEVYYYDKLISSVDALNKYLSSIQEKGYFEDTENLEVSKYDTWVDFLEGLFNSELLFYRCGVKGPGSILPEFSEFKKHLKSSCGKNNNYIDIVGGYFDKFGFVNVDWLMEPEVCESAIATLNEYAYGGDNNGKLGKHNWVKPD